MMLLYILLTVLQSTFALEAWELHRAHMPLPRAIAKAPGPHAIPAKLNQLILRSSPAEHKPCHDFELKELHKIHEYIVSRAHPVFQTIYASKNDKRMLRMNITGFA